MSFMKQETALKLLKAGENVFLTGSAGAGKTYTLNQYINYLKARKVSVAMYEGEINMVIHANGGKITVTITTDEIIMELADKGPGIPDVKLAMQEGFSTAPDNIRSLGFGAGMGLPNMKRYTDEMQIDSVVGEGTTITMRVKY